MFSDLHILYYHALCQNATEFVRHGIDIFVRHGIDIFPVQSERNTLQKEINAEFEAIVCVSYLHGKEPVAIAKSKNGSPSGFVEVSLCWLFRIKLFQLHIVVCHIDQKGNIVAFFHRMIQGNIQFSVKIFHMDPVFSLPLLPVPEAECHSRKKHPLP